MAKVVYEELVQAVTMTGKTASTVMQHVNQANVCLMGLIKAPVTGEAATSAQHHYNFIYSTLFNEIKETGQEIAAISKVLPAKFNECVPDSHGFEADTALLIPLRDQAKERKQHYESQRNFFDSIAYSGPLGKFSAYSSYCCEMASYYQQLADQMQEMIDKLTDVINGVVGFDAACSGLYDNVLSRLALVESMYESVKESAGSVGYNPSFKVRRIIRKINRDLKKRMSEADKEKKQDEAFLGKGFKIIFNIADEMRAAGFDLEDWDNIEMIGDKATKPITIDREAICTRGVEMVDSEKMPEEIGGDSCAWLCSKVYMECGKIPKEGSYDTGDYATGWYVNSYNYVNSEGMYTYFEGKPYTTVYKISGTAAEKEDALAALRASGKCQDGDLLFFDKEGDKVSAEDGGGIKDHVVILNGTYSSNGAADCDSQNLPTPEDYNGTTAFFGQNDNHYSYSVQASLEHTTVNGSNAYSDDTDLYVVAFNG